MDVTSFFYVSNNDTKKTSLRATASCDLDAQPLFTFHYMHLPDVENLFRLQNQEPTYICKVCINNY